MNIKDGQRIYRQFQRFAEYEDMRELYMKCIPEIAKFEKRIMDISDEVVKLNMVIRTFDEVLMQKAEKTQITKIYQFCEEHFHGKGKFNSKGINEEMEYKVLMDKYDDEMKDLKS